jgi:hypothetical protein
MAFMLRSRTIAEYSNKIVDDASEVDHKQKEKDHIDANHIEMCRFKSSEDPGYSKVKGALSKYIDLLQTRQEPGGNSGRRAWALMGQQKLPAC